MKRFSQFLIVFAVLTTQCDNDDPNISNIIEITDNHGGFDFWIVKLDRSGTIQWHKSLGGHRTEEARSVQQTADGGYIVAGSTKSNDGDVSGNHGFEWPMDSWIVKLNASGTIQWQKCLGGSKSERANSIQQTADGGYIVAGNTESNDGDVSGYHGQVDGWIVKLDRSGNIQWQKSLGGSEDELAWSIQQTIEGGYIVSASTSSNDGDVSGNHGESDSWIVKLDGSGTIQWQKCLGGSEWENPYSIQQTTDGGYIVAGSTKSNDGDVSGYHGQVDGWIVKLDESGGIQWQKSLGGSGFDHASSIQQTIDGGYIVSGSTESYDGDVSGYQGASGHRNRDYWIVKLDVTGTIQWQKPLGGDSIFTSYPSSIQQTSDDGFIVAGSSILPPN